MITQSENARHIEIWPIERPIPYALNARTHSEQQVAQIAASIVEFGFTTPLLVDRHSVVVAGHARLLAARKLNLTQVPVIVLDHLTEIQRRAYVLADNRLAQNAGWDDAMLRVEIAALEQELFNVELLGFDQDELVRLREELEEEAAEVDEDTVPQVSETVVSVPGDLWTLGPHRLLHGDSTSTDSIGRVMPGEWADLIFTDPPYNVDYHQVRGGAGADRSIMNDDLGEQFEKFLHDACVAMLSVARGAVYVCMSSSQLHTLHKAFTSAGGHWSTFLIWAKNAFTLGRSDYQRQYEPILYGWRSGTNHYWCGVRDQGDVWFLNKPHANELHPCTKPLELIERAIQNSSRRGGVVLDGFAGSGSTLIACEKTGRLARLVEIDPHYVDVIVRRWQAYTGQQAILEGDGRAFDEIAVERHTVNRREQPARDPDGTIASSELEGTDTENGV